MGLTIITTGGDSSPSWVGATLIAVLCASPFIVGLVWRFADRFVDRRRTSHGD